MQEISALANCNCDQITRYYDSCMLPNTSKLLIAMELMACSGSDLVRPMLSFRPVPCRQPVVHVLPFLPERTR